jgi:hypothetical protein
VARGAWRGPDPQGRYGQVLTTAVRVATVPDRDHEHGPTVAQLVDDAVDADAVGPQTGEPSAKLVSEPRVASEPAECVEDRIRQQRVERGQRFPRRASKKDLSHYERRGQTLTCRVGDQSHRFVLADIHWDQQTPLRRDPTDPSRTRATSRP